MPCVKLNEHSYCLTPRKINNSAYNVNGPHTEPTNIRESYNSNDKYKEGKNNVKISTEHAHCTSAKEPAPVNPENEIKKTLYHLSMIIVLQPKKLILIQSTLGIK